MNTLWSFILSKAEKFSESGWRRIFFWASVGTIATALPIMYVVLPLRGTYAPTEYLNCLNGTMTIVAGLAGLRAVEKHVARTGDANVQAV